MSQQSISYLKTDISFILENGRESMFVRELEQSLALK